MQNDWLLDEKIPKKKPKLKEFVTKKNNVIGYSNFIKRGEQSTQIRKICMKKRIQNRIHFDKIEEIHLNPNWPLKRIEIHYMEINGYTVVFNTTITQMTTDRIVKCIKTKNYSQQSMFKFFPKETSQFVLEDIPPKLYPKLDITRKWQGITIKNLHLGVMKDQTIKEELLRSATLTLAQLENIALIQEHNEKMNKAGQRLWNKPCQKPIHNKRNNRLSQILRPRNKTWTIVKIWYSNNLFLRAKSQYDQGWMTYQVSDFMNIEPKTLAQFIITNKKKYYDMLNTDGRTISKWEYMRNFYLNSMFDWAHTYLNMNKPVNPRMCMMNRRGPERSVIIHKFEFIEKYYKLIGTFTISMITVYDSNDQDISTREMRCWNMQEKYPVETARYIIAHFPPLINPNIDEPPEL